MADTKPVMSVSRNQHVDTSISTVDFTNSANVILYAKPHDAVNESFKAIGVVQGWSFTEQKQVEEVFEIGSDIKYIVPGRTNGQIAITRLLINGPDLVNALHNSGSTGEDKAGTKALRTLKDITKGSDLLFASYYVPGHSTSGKLFMTRHFSNAMIVARQESITANQVVIAENCTMVYETVSESTWEPPTRTD